MTEIIKLSENDKPTRDRLRDISNSLKEDCSKGDREVLATNHMMLFRGTPFWVLMENDVPISLNATYFGKRKKNAWEPYANWYTAFTRPSRRNQGHAKELAYHVRQLAIEAGCVRIRSLAGSYLGYRLHVSLGDLFWGKAKTGELVTDTPLVNTLILRERGREPFPTDTTPMSVRAHTDRVTPLSQEELEALLKTPLRYDVL